MANKSQGELVDLQSVLGGGNNLKQRGASANNSSNTNIYPVKDNWGIEHNGVDELNEGLQQNPALNKDATGIMYYQQPYRNTARFLPDDFIKRAADIPYFSLRFFFMEFWGVFFFTFIIYSSQAQGLGAVPNAFASGIGLFIISMAFWYHDGERPRLNLFTSFMFWVTGMYSGWYVLFDLVAQNLGALSAAGVVWGFFGDGGMVLPVGVWGVQFGWEIFAAFIFFMIQIMMYGTGRLMREGYYQERRTSSTGRPGTPGQSRPASNDRNNPFNQPMTPKNNEQEWDHVNLLDLTTSLVISMSFAILRFIGTAMNGGGINWYLWWPHAFSTDSIYNKGMAFMLYFFGEWISAIVAALMMMLIIFWTRRGFSKTMPGYNDARQNARENGDMQDYGVVVNV